MTNSRPRILYLTSHCPHEMTYGSTLRALHIGRLLQQCGEVSLILMPLENIENASLEQTKLEFDLKGVVRFEQSPPRSVFGRLQLALNPYCTNTHWGQINEQSAALIDQLLSEHDLVWFHGIRIPNCLGRKIWPRSVLDIDDVPSQYHLSVMRRAPNFSRRIMDFRKSLLWKRREQVLLKRFTILGVCSEEDRCYLGGSERVHLIPNGYAMPSREPIRTPANPCRIGFIGTLKYAPNVDGVRWFISDVWPRIKRIQKDARLRLVGLRTDSEITDLGPDIDGLGWVNDTAEEISSWSMMIVPIHVGGGTRVKIAEAFSRKCPVVATSLGAFGYKVSDKEELLLADSPERFANACVTLLSNPELGKLLAERAWERFCREWCWSAIGPKVAAAVEACLRYSHAAAW